jgi:hypothetical protein
MHEIGVRWLLQRRRSRGDAFSAEAARAGQAGSKTKGYQNLKDRSLVPAPVMTHPDRWRLDQLMAWEERRMEFAQAALEALIEPSQVAASISDLLPQPKRRRAG